MTVQHYMSHCNVKFWMNNPCQFINFWGTHKSDIIGENGPPYESTRVSNTCGF